ncbi:hypothetical protein KRP22_007675 [Phytophthora ramorum]|nr:Serine/threonine-protein kinase Nek5 [Phytophthora ramorum]
MAEPLYHLGDSVTWSPTSAPRGQLVLIQDCVEAGGEFLVHHFTSLFLKAGHRVCFVASANDPQHYAAVGRKLVRSSTAGLGFMLMFFFWYRGVNFAACERKKQLQVLDWTEVEADRDEGAWTVLFHKLKTFTSQEQEENVEISGVSIVLDDVSALKWRFGDAAVLDFARCCKTLTHEKNVRMVFFVLQKLWIHADTDLPTSRPLSPALADMATMVLATKPLTTGCSKDIHGTLSVYHQNQGLVGNSLHEEPPAIPYKILESIPHEHVATGERVCMKEIDMTFLSPHERARCLNEVELLQHLPQHPHIVGFREAFWFLSDEAGAQILVLILEYADGGDLEEYLRSPSGSPLQEDEARRIFKQLAQAVNHLHSHRVVHRDLKCGNVFLFRSGRVVLGDFGTSKLLLPGAGTGAEQELEAQGLTSTVVGSPLYMSPELLEGDPYGFATDIWSLGCVLYELFSGGKPAFAAPSYPGVVYRITQGQYDLLDSAVVSPEVHNLIASMLRKAPQERQPSGRFSNHPGYREKLSWLNRCQ